MNHSEPGIAAEIEAARHVFISYRRSQAVIVDELVVALDGRFRLWRDVDENRGGQRWRENVARAIQAAYAMIVVVSEDIEGSKEVYAEYFYALGIELPIIPLLVAGKCELPAGLEGLQARFWLRDPKQKVDELRQDLEHFRAAARPLEDISDEHAYLNSVKLGYLQNVQNYTAMAGQARGKNRGRTVNTHAVVMRPSISIRTNSPLLGGGEKAEEFVRDYENLLPALGASGAVVVLGEPGSGKTTTLFKYADQLREQVLSDPDAPLPLIVPLQQWHEQSWEELLHAQLGNLAAEMESLSKGGRLYLLLDGLNELPRDSARVSKLDRLRQEMDKNMKVVVTCRELDYRDQELSLDLDTIRIHPLDPQRIQDFLVTYLQDILGDDEGPRRARELFWQIAGGNDVEAVWKTWCAAGADLNLFFQSAEIPREAPNVYSQTSGKDDDIWQKQVCAADNLIRLAANPYLLWMFLSIYLDLEEVPANRGALFDEFVFHLLKREGLTAGDQPSADGRALCHALETLAWNLQRGDARTDDADGSGALTLPRADAARIVGGEQVLYQAASASLVEDSNPVRFSHQLLQEYFTARRLLAEIAAGLQARTLWPTDQWWLPSGWEEATILAAGMSDKDASTTLDWLLPVHPELAALCINRSGTSIGDVAKKRLRDVWLPALTDCKAHPDPAARAAIGRALVSVRLSRGALLDNRAGVGLDGHGLPDIVWSEPVLPQKVDIENYGRVEVTKAFRMALFPVTNIQFEAFIRDQHNGFEKRQWWTGLEQSVAPELSGWTEANHPRETVSWYEAMAFCRWLSARLQLKIHLPTEAQWQLASTGGDAKRTYPWGGQWDGSLCNSGESGPGRTTPVGIYPRGQSPCGSQDMAGNVWEWCRNTYEHPADDSDASGGRRVLRGGSWGGLPEFLRSSNRNGSNPDGRFSLVGFRLAQDIE